MASLSWGKLLTAAFLAGAASAAAAQEPDAWFGRWAKSKCKVGAARTGHVLSRAAGVASRANRYRIEEFARDAYFSLVEYKESVGNERAEPSPLAGENAEFYFDRGRVRTRRGEYDAAISDFNACLRLAPNNAPAYFARGYAWGEKKEYYRGIRDFDRCIRIEPRFAKAYGVRGMYWLTLEDADQALADFDVFVRIDGSGWAHFCRALPWIRKAEPSQAESDLAQAVLLDPDNDYCHLLLGCMRLWTRDDAGAIEAFDKALKLSPDLAAAYAVRALAWKRQGKPAEAAQDWARAKSLDPEMKAGSPPTRNCTFRVRVKGDGDRFKCSFRWKNPDVAYAAGSRRGLHYYAGGEYAGGAAARYRGYYEGLDPITWQRTNTLNEQAWHWATSRYENLRDGVRAVEAAREACELTHWKDASCLDTLAAAYAQCGDFESADKFQTLALELWPAYLDGRRRGERRLARYRQQQPLEPEDTYLGSYRSAASNAPQQPAPAQNAAVQKPQQSDVNWGAFKPALPVEKYFDAENFKPKIKRGLLASPQSQQNSAAANSAGTNSSANASASPDQTRQTQSAPVSWCPRIIAPGLAQDDLEAVQALTQQAWLQATSRYETARDGVGAVEAALEACELSEWRVWACLEALAAAYAECGDFESADKYQTLAEELAAEGPSDARHAAARRHATYRSRRAIHQGE